MFQFVDHQSIAIDAQALLGNWRASHVAAQALEFAALTGFAADGGIDGKPISCGGEETNRPVRSNILDVDVKRYDLYHIAPYAANLEPAGLQPGGVEKLFISRRSSRRLSNEKEILAIAEALGYTTCYFEDIPLRQQWTLARDARSIIAIHGAALGFLGTKGKPKSAPSYQLLEILSPGLVADVFRKTSAVLGGRWMGCRGRLSSDFVKHVEESANFRCKEGADSYIHPDAFERACGMLEDCAD